MYMTDLYIIEKIKVFEYNLPPPLGYCQPFSVSLFAITWVYIKFATREKIGTYHILQLFFLDTQFALPYTSSTKKKEFLSKLINNVLTIDIEDYFQVHAFSGVINPASWDNYKSRVEHNTYKVLELLDRRGAATNQPKYSKDADSSVKATFFILGWIAERYPGLVKEIMAQGHEVASHGYCHTLVTRQTPEEFRADIAKTKKILEDITGDEVIGYRASTYSITKKTVWALKILAEEGYRYDSSIFPVYHDVYGFPGAPRFPFKVNLKGDALIGLNHSTPSNDLNSYSALWEFPVSTFRFWGQNLPVAGGGYFRLFPYWLTKRLIGRINRREKKPFVFYIHPWEFDPDQPRIYNAPLKSRFRHYLNLNKVEDRFRKLLRDFKFVAIKDLMWGK